MTALNDFRSKLHNEQFEFAETLAFIAEHYDYQPSAFTNGNVENAAGQNEGSCKTLGLALLEGFNLEETLLCFGEHYRSVLATPEGSDHANIRALISNGLAGVKLSQQPLSRKAA
ncbi:HopJ type III effector protein [Ectopseudomonas mendocina]|uniref:HopJ type III effector protein n=1 Tax=Ectopseudomonas mendocina TaxID=300 RepID=A0ABZ2RE70_ECTME